MFITVWFFVLLFICDYYVIRKWQTTTNSSLIGPIFAMMYNVQKHILAVSVIINIRELISFQ